MDPASILGQGRLDTHQAQFLLPSETDAPRSVLLRGVNLSSSAKYPNFSSSRRRNINADSRKGRDELRRFQAGLNTSLSEDCGFWSDAENGGEDGWFVGKPLEEEEADIHLKRLRAWGFTTIRLIVTWEALEHAGPGKYDELYIDYLIRLLRKCQSQGFRVFISPHQDVFSRFIGGSGAPYWILEAFGINPRRIHSTCAAILHSEFLKEGYNGEDDHGPYPDMIWNTNEHRLAARHCSTMFFASKLFAPKCIIDGAPAGEWARRLHDEAYGHLADRIRDAGGLLDECLIGWDSMNEPHQGFIGIPDMGVIPDSQDFRKGRCPTPLQGFRLAVGEKVDGIANDDFTSLGLKNLGTVTHTPPKAGLWLTRDEAETAQKRWGYKWGPEWDFWDAHGQYGCPWAGHGVWDRNEGKMLKPDYFANWDDGRNYDFMADFWRPYYVDFVRRIRRAHPQAISLIHPAIFEMPPDLSEDKKSGRMALSSHFYDGLTMLGKRRHKFNANTVGLHRGHVGMLGAAKIGTGAVRKNMRQQFEELKGDAYKVEGMAREQDDGGGYPTLIGELGSPWDMKKTKWFGILRGKDDPKDYKEPAKAMDELLNGCEGSNALSWTLWCYEPTNTHKLGDGWNMEDLSIFTYDDLDGDQDVQANHPADLRQLVTLGSRGIEAWCRPYPISVTGQIVSFSFSMESSEFDLVIESPSSGSAVIFLPYVHYLRQSTEDEGQGRLIGKPGDQEWRSGHPAVIDIKVVELSSGSLDARGQLATWTYPATEGELRLKLKRWGDKPNLA